MTLRRPGGHAVEPSLKLSAIGFAATAVAFGPARVGFGLFLPDFREAFGLSTSLAGLISSGGFFAFLVALPVAAWLDDRFGPRAPVVAGALAAAAGFAAAALAQSVAVLAAGVALAGTSAGFCWSPFNDAAERMASPERRPTALSAVSTGSTTGVAIAGALALGVAFGAFDWRVAWGGFLLVALAAAAANLFGLPTGRSAPPEGAARPALVRRAALPLHAAALAFGATNAAFLAFAADRVVSAGGLPGLPERAASPAIYIAYGVCGLVGLATGRMEARVGLPGLVGAVFAGFSASMVLVALAPGSWPGVLAAAGLHGAAVMTISAVLSFWSLRLFPGRGAVGFTAALGAAAAGSAIGPALSGKLLDAVGPETGFLALAVVPAAAAASAFAAGGARRLRKAA